MFRTEDRKGAGTHSKKSDTRNLEAESLGSRAESTGRCVKLKTVTEIAESFSCTLNSSWDWRPEERLKQRSDMLSFMFFQDEASSTVLNAPKAMVSENLWLVA